MQKGCKVLVWPWVTNTFATPRFFFIEIPSIVFSFHPHKKTTSLKMKIERTKINRTWKILCENRNVSKEMFLIPHLRDKGWRRGRKMMRICLVNINVKNWLDLRCFWVFWVLSPQFPQHFHLKSSLPSSHGSHP